MSKTEIKAELIGLSELKEKFANLGTYTTRVLIEFGLMAGALPIVNEAKELAPVKTGTLRRSIHEGEVEWESEDVASIKIGVSLAEVSYAARQEFGFTGEETVKAHTRTIKKTGTTYEVGEFVRQASTPAHPYLRPAFDNKKDEAVKEMGDAMVAVLKKRAALR